MREYALNQALSNGSHALATLGRVASNWLKRRKLHRLEELDDHILDDIGLTRDELTRALRLPLVVNPLQELDRLSYARRRAAQRRR